MDDARTARRKLGVLVGDVDLPVCQTCGRVARLAVLSPEGEEVLACGYHRAKITKELGLTRMTATVRNLTPEDYPA